MQGPVIWLAAVRTLIPDPDWHGSIVGMFLACTGHLGVNMLHPHMTWQHACTESCVHRPLTRLAAVSVVEPGLSCSTQAVAEPGCLVTLWAAAMARCGRHPVASKSAAEEAVLKVGPLLLLLVLVLLSLVLLLVLLSLVLLLVLLSLVLLLLSLLLGAAESEALRPDVDALSSMLAAACALSASAPSTCAAYGCA